MRGRGWARLAPLMSVVFAGCFATRGDVVVLQGDIARLRTESAQADSARAEELDRVIASLGAVRDTLGALSGRSGRWQGEMRGDLQAIREQLITLQELSGQSQRRLQELRADLERPREVQVQPGAASEAAPATPPDSDPAVTDAPAPAASSGETVPGPNQMLQIALDQLRRGSGGAARTALQDLLERYPDADVAPDAQYYLAESFATDGEEAAADEAYVEVYSRFPSSPRAPTALYKHAMILRNGGREADARAAFNRIVREYPRSDAAVLAREQLSAGE